MSETIQSFRQVLRLRDFSVLWAGETISLMGDQFYFIAMPWLALQLTNSTFAMGTVLAMVGVPRALFMLMGGAVTDRLSPQKVMLISNSIRMVLFSALAIAVIGENVTLWMLYAAALALGLIDAFFVPAQGSIVPRLVPKEQLRHANSMIQTSTQLSYLAGPLLAGGMIGFIAKGNAAGGNITGTGIAFAVDACTFLVSVVTLLLLGKSSVAQKKSIAEGEAPPNLIKSIKSGIMSILESTSIRTIFMMVLLYSFFLQGPLYVGIPVLANTRYRGAVTAYGIIMSSYGLGALAGTAIGTAFPNPLPQRRGILLLGLTSLQGLCFALLGIISSTALAAINILIMGMAMGYVNLLFVTFLQRYSSPEMLGRTMSFYFFSMALLYPLSTTLTGYLVGYNPTIVYIIAGILLAARVLITLRKSELHDMPTTPEACPRNARDDANATCFFRLLK